MTMVPKFWSPVGSPNFLDASDAIIIWGFEFTSDLPLLSLKLFTTKSIFSWPPEIDQLFSLSFSELKIPEFVTFVGTYNGEGLAELQMKCHLVSQSVEQFLALSQICYCVYFLLWKSECIIYGVHDYPRKFCPLAGLQYWFLEIYQDAQIL